MRIVCLVGQNPFLIAEHNVAGLGVLIVNPDTPQLPNFTVQSRMAACK